MMMWDGTWGMGGFAWLWMTLFWVFAISGIVWLVLTLARSVGPGGSGAGRAEGDSAERILGDRLARGEIDPEEYRTRLAALREGRR